MLKITWFGHSTFCFVLSSGETIVIDPWIDDNPLFPKGFEFDRVDTILVTHGHSDHAANVQSLASKFSPKVIANFEVASWLESKGVANTVGINKGGSVEVGSVTVTMTHAFHSSSIKDDDGALLYGGEPAGYVIRLPDKRSLYFAGDTEVFGDMALIKELHAPELVFLPIGGFYTMDPRAAAVACRLLAPKRVIPMHYGTFPPLKGTPEELKKLVGDSCDVWKLEIGSTVSW